MGNSGSIKLKNPIMVAGSEVIELAYDFDKVTPDMFMEADMTAANKAAVINKPTFAAAEVDSSFHLQLGIQAIIAANPTWDANDVSRIHGSDIFKVMFLGRNFMTAVAEEDDEAESDDATEASDDRDELREAQE